MLLKSDELETIMRMAACDHDALRKWLSKHVYDREDVAYEVIAEDRRPDGEEERKLICTVKDQNGKQWWLHDGDTFTLRVPVHG